MCAMVAMVAYVRRNGCECARVSVNRRPLAVLLHQPREWSQRLLLEQQVFTVRTTVRLVA
jgi:hypothetical protein